MTDGDGMPVEHYSYSSYGEVGTEGVLGNPFRYTGRQLDPDTGLYYYRARYYAADIGRFLQTDPIGYGDGLNMYRYAGNDPENFIDPTGTIEEIIDIGYVHFGDSICGRAGTECVDGGGIDIGSSPAISIAGDGGGSGGAAAPAPKAAPPTSGQTKATKITLLKMDKYGCFVSPSGQPILCVGVGAIGEEAELLEKFLNPKSIANAINLAKQLASESGIAELLEGGGKVIAGAGTKVPLQDAGRLVSEYGGSPGDWTKITSTAPGQIQTHAYRNVVTGQVVELKSIP